MTSRERVLTTFGHEVPDRVPAWCGASEEFWAKAKRELELDDEGLLIRFGDDFRRVKAGFTGPNPELSTGATMRTVFGIEREGLGYGQPMSHPLSGATLEQVHEYPWPDPEWIDASSIRAEALKHGGEYAILGGDWSPFWHDAIDLVDMETLYLDMLERPDVVDALLGHMVDFYFASNVRILEEAADVIDIMFIGNDFGGQTGPLLSPAMFQRYMVPHLRRLAGLGHDYGLKVMLHCCGGVAELIPDLIACGIDALHTVQTTCRGMDLPWLKSEFGDRLVFNGAIDSHHILIEGDPAAVRAGTKQVLDIMMPNGGYIAGASHDTILEETPVENVLAMFDAIREFGVY